MHMRKITKELDFLTEKGKEQEKRLTCDFRIVELEKQLKWFMKEFESLMGHKER